MWWNYILLLTSEHLFLIFWPGKDLIQARLNSNAQRKNSKFTTAPYNLVLTKFYCILYKPCPLVRQLAQSIHLQLYVIYVLLTISRPDRPNQPVYSSRSECLNMPCNGAIFKLRSVKLCHPVVTISSCLSSKCQKLETLMISVTK